MTQFEVPDCESGGGDLSPIEIKQLKTDRVEEGRERRPSIPFRPTDSEIRPRDEKERERVRSVDRSDKSYLGFCPGLLEE